MKTLLLLIAFAVSLSAQYTPPPGGRGCTSSGSAGTVQVAGATSGSCNSSLLFWDGTNKKFGINAGSQQLATVTGQPPAPSTLASCTTTANATGHIVAVGAGCLFLTQITSGDRIYLSSDTANICTVTHVTSNTDLMLDNDYWGDSCGDGTSQTITVLHSVFQLRNSSGLPVYIMNDEGHIAFAPVPLVTEAGDPVVPTPSQLIAIRSAITGTLLDLESQTLASNSANIFELNNQFNALGHAGSGAVTNFFENDSYGFINAGAGKITNAAIYYGQVTNYSATAVDKLGVFWAKSPPPQSGAGGFTEGTEFYGEDLGSAQITNPYYYWFDSRGVRRVKEDNTFDSVGQAIEALYNPLFVKYTPGAANYERIVLGQWHGNVAEVGTECGGTGTCRAIAILSEGKTCTINTTTGVWTCV